MKNTINSKNIAVANIINYAKRLLIITSVIVASFIYPVSYVLATPEQNLKIKDISYRWMKTQEASNEVVTNGAIYLTIENNSETLYQIDSAMVLTENGSSVAANIELHDVITDDKGVSKMQKMDKLNIPGRSEDKPGVLEMKSGGMHIMLFGIRVNTEKPFFVKLHFTDNNIMMIPLNNK